ncbi:DUF7130 family rubredoxin-like protein [Halorubrum lipolyticum]|uniref:DUF7130 domain-containing protein n=1 Tax=Halorubrum lipolyticum DSM 21995 TaxID=1227482 RepID=M0P294_9EURY|nr:hypothetical protein [Halorubrum lipolyticum]EMA64272.1 hypothetical protein C469_01180 [Halorubrum lipolyticum DSM 21995]
MSEGTRSDPGGEAVAPGETVYGEDGRVLGRVSGYTADGFEVATGESGSTGGDHAETIPGQEFGEGYLMWRCGECGEMGDLEGGMPDRCPSCGAPEEAIAAIEED